MPLLTVGLLFVFGHRVSTLQLWKFTVSLKLRTKDIAGSSKQQRKRGYQSHENPVSICICQDASMECLLAGRFSVLW